MATPVLKRLKNVLAHYGLEPQSNIELCNRTGLNEVFFVTTERGKIALKHHIQNSNLQRLQQEVSLSKKLIQQGVPCPKILQNKTGRSITEYQRQELYIASEYLEGETFPTGSAIQEHHIRNAARAIARFHQAVKDEKLPLLSNHIASYDLTSLTNRLMTYRCELHTLEQSYPNASNLLSLVHNAMPKAMALSRLLTDELIDQCKKVIIHGDFTSTSLLLAPDGGVQAFLDLDDAREDLRIYDLFQLALYCVDEGYGQNGQLSQRDLGWKTCIPALLNGYSEIEKLSEAELTCFPAMLRVHFLRMLSDPRLDISDRDNELVIEKLQYAMTHIETDIQTLTEIIQQIISAEYA